MQVWAVLYDPDAFHDSIYERALPLVDDESLVRIKRFRRRDDACRTLIGRLLVRMMLHVQGIKSTGITFGTTNFGKPFIRSPVVDPPIGFNITHDNSLVALAFSRDKCNPPAFGIGVDVMKVRIPKSDSYETFVNAMNDQLTPLERQQLFDDASHDERLKRFFWMWTLKEAYVKALGLGMHFEFPRVEFDTIKRVVRVDGEIPRGWRFSMFVLHVDGALYEGVVAELLGEDFSTVVMEETVIPEFLVQFDATEFVMDAIAQLSPKSPTSS